MAQDAEERQASQNGDASIDAELDVHGPRALDEAGGEHGAREVVCGEQGRHVARVCRWQPADDALEDDKGEGGPDGDARRGRDPVDVGSRGPREYEQADGHAPDTDQACFEPGFGLDGLACRGLELACLWDEVVMEVEGVSHHAKGTPDAESGEDETHPAERHLVGAHKNNWERLKNE